MKELILVKPYPGYPPNYKSVDKHGGFNRNCLVIEILSLDGLGNTSIALIKEQIEATLARLTTSVGIEKVEVVSEERFDRFLKDGLRLS